MTRIDYPDLVRTSPDGQLRLAIRSPDNAPSPREPVHARQLAFGGGFQSDFTFTVNRVADGTVLWERTPKEDDSLFAPNDAWISNAGHVVIITRPSFGSGLFVLNPSGKVLRRFDVANDLLNGNSREFHWTSAGAHWNENGHGLFLAVDQQLLWVFRTELNRQIVVELGQGNLVALDEKIRRECRQKQRRWALATVHKHSENQKLYGELTTKFDWRMLSRLRTAIFWCGLDRIRSALPELRRFEQSTVAASWTSGWRLGNREETNLVKLALPGVAQFAQRRIGEEPVGIAPFWLCQDRGGSPKGNLRIAIPERILDRFARLEQLQTGMTQAQVADLVGMPDVNKYTSWQYDVLSSEESYTLDLTWHRRKDTVTKIERQAPGWIKWKSRVGYM